MQRNEHKDICLQQHYKHRMTGNNLNQATIMDWVEKIMRTSAIENYACKGLRSISHESQPDITVPKLMHLVFPFTSSGF